MNLVQINERLKDMPMQALQQYANGMNPEVPPYLALGELQRREMAQKQMANAQGAAQGPQPSVKEQVEQKAGLMALQQMQQQQAQQQMMGQMAQRPGPAPAGVPQPEAQPEVMMARGGLTQIPVRRDMFDYAGGGIVAFQEGGSVEEKYRRESEEMGEGKRIRYSPDVQAYAKQLRATENASQEEFAQRERQRMLSQSREIAPQRPAQMAGPDVTAETMQRVGPMTAPKFEDPRIPKPAEPAAPAGLPGALLTNAKPPAMGGAPAATAAPRPAPAAAPVAGLPSAAAQSGVTPLRDEALAMAREKPVAPTAAGIIEQQKALSPAAMQEEFMQKRMQEQRDRAAAERAAFEKSRPSGLDDLIRVFGQASQYKGLSGMGPAYTANKQQQRAEELAMEKRQNELLNAIDAREYEGGKELFGARSKSMDAANKSYQDNLQSKTKALADLAGVDQRRIDEALQRLTQVQIQQMRDASQKLDRERQGRGDDLIARVIALRAKGDDKAADMIVKTVNDLKGGASGERNDITAIKAIQAGLIKELSENIRMDPATRAKKQTELDKTYADLAALGGVGAGTADKPKTIPPLPRGFTPDSK